MMIFYRKFMIFIFLISVSCNTFSADNLEEVFYGFAHGQYSSSYCPRISHDNINIIRTNYYQPVREFETSDEVSDEENSLEEFSEKFVDMKLGDYQIDYELEECLDGRSLICPPKNTVKAGESEKSGRMESIVNPIDGRRLVKNYKEWPYSIHGKMIMNFRNGKSYIGSGTMVSSHHVLTAGHNIYSHEKSEGWAIDVTFIPAMCKKERPFKEVKATTLLSVKGWVSNKNKEFDIGMIVLSEPIGYLTGWAGLMYSPRPHLPHQTIRVTGYPGDKSLGTEMCTMKGKITDFEYERFFYNKIDTNGGQSGSAVWLDGLKDNKGRVLVEGKYVLGVHSYAKHDKYGQIIEPRGNSATRISKEKFDILLGWIAMYHLKRSDFTELYNLNPLSLQFSHSYSTYETEANAGNAKSQFVLAKIYENGIGKSKDEKKARFWYKKSANLEYPESLFNVGMFHEKGTLGFSPDLSRSVSFYKRARQLGNLDATFRLAHFYQKGILFKENIEQAFSLYTEAAKGGHFRSQYILGRAYETGNFHSIKHYMELGINKKTATNYYRLSSNQNYARAQYYFGRLLLQSKNSDKRNEGRHWMKRSARNKFEPALRYLDNR